MLQSSDMSDEWPKAIRNYMNLKLMFSSLKQAKQMQIIFNPMDKN